MSSFSFLEVFVYAFLIFVCGDFTESATYINCIKIFFGYNKYYSVTQMLIQLGLPSFNTVVYNAQLTCNNRLKSSVNSLVQTSDCLTGVTVMVKLWIWYVSYMF